MMLSVHNLNRQTRTWLHDNRVTLDGRTEPKTSPNVDLRSQEGE